MAAREGLKGAGQVTDFEGTKGEDAIAALDTAQSDSQYLTALDNLERMMRTSYEDLQRKASLDKVSTGGDRRADQLGTAPAVGAAVGADGLGGLPDGTVIRDGSGKRFRIQGGQPVPVQ